MLKITLIFAVKKLSASALAGLAEYQKRLSQSCQLDWQTGAGEDWLRPCAPTTRNLILNRRGQSLSSPEFANQIQTWMTQGKSQLRIFIGHDLGDLSDSSANAPFMLSLSPAALSDPTAGLLLTEQIYRAFRILENKSYHK